MDIAEVKIVPQEYILNGDPTQNFFLIRKRDGTNIFNILGDGTITVGGGGGGGTWGTITGTLSNQTDLNTALNLKWSTAGSTTLTAATSILGTTTNTLSFVFDNLSTSQTNGAGTWIRNTTSATVGAQQRSPSIVLEAQGWKTNATAASQSIRIIQDILPVQGAANPYFNYNVGFSINGGTTVPLILMQYADVNTTFTGQGSIYIGVESGQAITTAANNTFVGNNSGRVLTTGIQNTVFGSRAGVSLTTGGQNTFLGQGAGFFYDTQSEVICIGFHAGLNAYGTTNTFVGTYSGRMSGTVANNTGDNNTALGWSALSGTSFTTGIRNVALGSQSGLVISTGSNNVMGGFQSGSGITTGSANTLIGSESGKGITTAGFNTMLGYQTGRSVTGQGNTIVGAAAGAVISTGTFNVNLGYLSGQTITTGSNNITIGQVDVLSATTSNQMNIHNSIYGLANSGTGTTLSTGTLGIYVQSPTASLDIIGSTTAKASLRLRTGVAPTSPNDGDIWQDGTDLKIRIGGVTKTVTLI